VRSQGRRPWNVQIVATGWFTISSISDYARTTRDRAQNFQVAPLEAQPVAPRQIEPVQELGTSNHPAHGLGRKKRRAPGIRWLLAHCTLRTLISSWRLGPSALRSE
jgi:hypothetical protein